MGVIYINYKLYHGNQSATASHSTDYCYVNTKAQPKSVRASNSTFASFAY